MEIRKDVSFSTYIDIDEQVDIDIELEDVLDYINQATDYQLSEIRKTLVLPGPDNEEFITFDNLYEREKVLLLKDIKENANLEHIQVLKQIFDKCDFDELQELLIIANDKF